MLLHLSVEGSFILLCDDPEQVFASWLLCSAAQSVPYPYIPDYTSTGLHFWSYLPGQGPDSLPRKQIFPSEKMAGREIPVKTSRSSIWRPNELVTKNMYYM